MLSAPRAHCTHFEIPTAARPGISLWHGGRITGPGREVMMRDYSPHAARRTAQRSVSEQLVEFALAWGRPINQDHGRTAYHLGRKEAAQARAAGVDVPERAIDVTVVLAADGVLVTSFAARTANGWKPGVAARAEEGGDERRRSPPRAGGARRDAAARRDSVRAVGRVAPSGGGQPGGRSADESPGALHASASGRAPSNSVGRSKFGRARTSRSNPARRAGSSK